MTEPHMLSVEYYLCIHIILHFVMCIELETSELYWSVYISLGGEWKSYSRYSRYVYYAYIDATHWTTKLSYVCQYHSKSLYGLSLSVYQ